MYKNSRISAIAAIGRRTRALGRGNDLIWRISDDLKRFKEITTGHPIIMGRKTYESIGRPLPQRINIVVSSQDGYQPQGVVVVKSMLDAIEFAEERDAHEVFVIGGGQIYQEAMPYIHRLYLTLIDDDPPPKDVDTFFPDYSSFTKEISREERETSDGLKYVWVTLER